MPVIKLPMAIFKAVGDIMLARLVGEAAKRRQNNYPFESVAAVLGVGDVVFGNLECPLSGRGFSDPESDPGYTFRAEPAMAGRLKAAGFNVVSLANNHIFNYGRQAFFDTREILKSKNILYVGAGANENEARIPAVISRGGVRFGFLAYTYANPAGDSSPGCAPMEIKKIAQDIKKLRPQVDVLAVSLHHGIEFLDYPINVVKKTARAAIDCGADLVLGHHPHNLQGVEPRRNGLIAYSLGDFVFDNADANIRAAVYKRTALSLVIGKPLDLQDVRTLEGMILECEFSGKGLVAYQMVPVRIGNDFAPAPATGEDRKNILSRIDALSRPLKNDADPIWKEIDFVDNKIKEIVLSQLPLKDAVKMIKKFKPHYLAKLPAYFKSKIFRKK